MQLRWTPENDQAGTYQFRFRAIDSADPDNVLITEIEVPVTVFNQNRRPVVQAIQNVTVPKDEVVEIPVIGSDADGHPLILSLMNESPFRPVPGCITLHEDRKSPRLHSSH